MKVSNSRVAWLVGLAAVKDGLVAKVRAGDETLSLPYAPLSGVDVLRTIARQAESGAKELKELAPLMAGIASAERNRRKAERRKRAKR